MSVVDLPALKPHWASGYTRSASVCNISRATRANYLPKNAEKGYSAVVLKMSARYKLIALLSHFQDVPHETLLPETDLHRAGNSKWLGERI